MNLSYSKSIGADDGSRNHIAGLEDRGFAVKLHPHIGRFTAQRLVAQIGLEPISDDLWNRCSTIKLLSIMTSPLNPFMVNLAKDKVSRRTAKPSYPRRSSYWHSGIGEPYTILEQVFHYSVLLTWNAEALASILMPACRGSNPLYRQLHFEDKVTITGEPVKASLVWVYWHP